MRQGEIYEKLNQTHSDSIYAANYAPINTIRALGELLEEIGDTVMWFFVPALLAGIYRYFREGNWREPEKFFITALIALNMLLMIWLYCGHGYISGRHTLPLVAFTIFFVPAGLQTLVDWFREKFPKEVEQSAAVKADRQFWFLVLLIIGISICIPKLLRPTRIKKQGYRDAAQWLAKNTSEKDIIAVSDIRISFYAGRRGIRYNGRAIPKEAQYVAKVFKNKKDKPTEKEMLQTKEVFSIKGDGKKPKVIIYRQTH